MAPWIDIEDNSGFSLQNLPYGVFSTSTEDKPARIGVAVGQYVLDLHPLAEESIFDGLGFDTTVLRQASLNSFASLGRHVQLAVRKRIQGLFDKDTELGAYFYGSTALRSKALIPLSSVKMHLPMIVGDYTDFFVGLHHAEIVSCTSHGPV